MVFALVLLGLLPLVFLGDIFPGGNDVEDDTADEDNADGDSTAPVSGDFLAEILRGPGVESGVESGIEAGGVETGVMDDTQDDTTDDTEIIGSAILPNTEDDSPVDGEDVDPASVIGPNEGDDSPVEGDPVDPDTVIGPNEDPEDEFPIDGEGSLLQQLVAEQSDADTGIGYLQEPIGGIETLELTPADDTHAEPDDGIAGNGDGSLSDWNGTPILTADAPIRVISGGDGNDTIATGDAAAYVFGGAGDDRLSVGDGAAALFGGIGDDTLTGSDTAASFLDGGLGNDTIQGGEAAEVIHGGAHDSDNAEASDDDTIDGGGGDDVILGGYGADTLSGGDGNDVIDHLGRTEEDIVWERQDFAWHIDNEADRLDGGAGDDMLIMDRADTATGGSGADVFWVYFDELSGSGAAEITDFEIGQDVLRVTLNPEVGSGDPDVTIGPSADGQDSLISVDGEVVAILRGVPDAGAADIYAEVAQNVFV